MVSLSLFLSLSLIFSLLFPFSDLDLILFFFKCDSGKQDDVVLGFDTVDAYKVIYLFFVFSCYNFLVKNIYAVWIELDVRLKSTLLIVTYFNVFIN